MTLHSSEHAMTPKKKESWGSFILFLIVVIMIRSFLFSPFRIPSGSMIPTLQVGDFIMTSKSAYGWSRYSLFLGGYVPYFSGRWMSCHTPQRGDVIVFANPQDTSQDWIKRVIGLPGDRVRMEAGHLFLNGQEVILREVQKDYRSHDSQSPITGTLYEVSIPRGQEMYRYTILKQNDFGQLASDYMSERTVPEGCVFCMGDNWDGSQDSRFSDKLGMIPMEYVIARALFIFFSVNCDDLSWNPLTWIALPFKIRLQRCGYIKL